jgi:hypothetical protein
VAKGGCAGDCKWIIQETFLSLERNWCLETNFIEKWVLRVSVFLHIRHKKDLVDWNLQPQTWGLEAYQMVSWFRSIFTETYACTSLDLLDGLTTRILAYYNLVWNCIKCRHTTGIDLSEKIYEDILVERDSFAFYVEVVYEKIPSYCPNCKIIRHSIHHCITIYDDLSITVIEYTRDVKKNPNQQVEKSSEQLEGVKGKKL